MEVLGDKAACGPLCQHPSCWSAARRRRRRQPTFSSEPSYSAIRDASLEEEDEDGLPTQSVVNLLDSCGFDLMPASVGVTEQDVQQHSRPTKRRASITGPGGKTPSTCPPSSYNRPCVPHVTPVTASLATSRDIQAAALSVGHVPEEKPPPRMGQVEVQELFDLQDLHSDWHDTFMDKKCYVWVPKPSKAAPRQGRRTPGSAGSARKKRKDPRMVSAKDVTEDMMPEDVELQRQAATLRDSSYQFFRVWCEWRRKMNMRRSPERRRELDIKSPHAHIHTQFHGDMLDRERFIHAFIKALPELEKGSTAISLSQSEVLQQSKMNIRGGQEKPLSKPRDLLEARQRFYMDPDVLRNLSPAVSPTKLTPSSSPIHSAKLMKKPLPAIGKSKDDKGDTGRISSISLGLPEIPSGCRYTRPFSYGKQDMDFTLGPVPPPKPQPARIPTIPPPPPKKTDSVDVSSEPGSSTLHVTVPSVLSDAEAMAPMPREKTADTEAEGEGSPPMHKVSPAQSTNVPKTPHGTPATRHSNYSYILDGSSPQVHTQVAAGTPVVNGVAALEQSAGALGPIPETEEARSAQMQSKSRRSVRFAAGSTDVPAQPPSSPESEHGTSMREPATVEGASLSMHLQTAEGDDHTNRTSTELKMASTARYGGVSPDGMSEPWPQVQEEEYHIMESPPKTGGTSASSLGPHASMVVNYDSDHAMLPRSAGHLSRESSMHSAKMIMMERVTESPAPPPPSPEPKDSASAVDAISRESTVVNVLEDIIETDSEVTLTAKPPSNLDDISRINTPVATPVYPEVNKQNYPPFENYLKMPSRQHTPATPGSGISQGVQAEQPVQGVQAEQPVQGVQAEQPVQGVAAQSQEQPQNEKDAKQVEQPQGNVDVDVQPIEEPHGEFFQPTENREDDQQTEQPENLAVQLAEHPPAGTEEAQQEGEPGLQGTVETIMKPQATNDPNIDSVKDGDLENTEDKNIETQLLECAPLLGDDTQGLDLTAPAALALASTSPLCEEFEKERRRVELDQFDVTDDALKDELKEEYDKLESEN